MIAGPIGRIPWRQWEWAEWNDALFEFFFRAREGTPREVSRLVVTGDELLRVVGDRAASPEEVHEAFRSAIIRRLRHSRSTLCRDASKLDRASGSNAPRTVPPFFAHLVVTCIAATATHSAKRPNFDFRRRLNEFLGRGAENASYPLSRLPNVWESFRDRLGRAAAAGEAVHSLVLKRAEHLRLIGYSLELAFPPLRDMERLVRVLGGLPNAPPALLVLKRIESSSTRFSPRFRRAYDEFREAYRAQEEDLHNWPFWGAVLDALTSADLRARGEDRPLPPSFALRLDPDEARNYLLTLYSSERIDDAEPFGCVEAGDWRLDGHAFIMTDREGAADPVVQCLLDGRLGQCAARLQQSELFRLVAGGVLLFRPDEDGIWLCSSSPPAVGPVRLVVRNDLTVALIEALAVVGDAPLRSASPYAGWDQVGELDSAQLLRADLEGTRLADVGCLLRVLGKPRIQMMGGVRMGDAWLGRRLALPRFLVGADRDEMTIVRPGNPGEPASILVPGSMGANERVIGEDFLDGRDLDGAFLVRWTRAGRVRAQRPLEFRSTVLECGYRRPSGPVAWFGEGARTAVEDLSPDGSRPSDVDRDPNSGWSTVGAGVSEFSGIGEATGSPDRRIAALVDTIAAVSLGRSGIPVGDMLQLFGRALQIRGRLLWDVLRAWEEGGFFDLLAFRRWRKRSFFARHPRLIARRVAPDRLRATLVGLVPSGIRLHVLEDCRKLGIECEEPRPLSPFVPSTMVLGVDSQDLLRALSDRAGLGTPRTLVPLAALVSSVETIGDPTAALPVGPCAWEWWDWEHGGFRADPGDPLGGVRVRLHRRPDAPDTFVVDHGEETIFVTRSRTWCFLRATTLSGRHPFAPDGGVRVSRSHDIEAFLPLALGRWSTAATGLAPGTLEREAGGSDHVYTFPATLERDAALDALWPGLRSAPIDRRGLWLLNAVRNAHGCEREGLVPLPEMVRRALHRLQLRAGVRGCADIRFVPRWILPRVIAYLRESDRPAADRVARRIEGRDGV